MDTLCIMLPLPHEITDRVIDFLWDDQRTLYNCALTCRAWLPRSQFVMYQNIHIRDRRSFDAIVYASQIQKLQHLVSNTEFLSLRASVKDPDSHPWTHTFPFTLSRCFSDVTFLEMWEINWAKAPPPFQVFTVGFSQLTGVDTLFLKRCSFKSFRQMQRLLCALPRLRILTVYELDFQHRLAPGSSQEDLSRGLLTSNLRLTSLSTMTSMCSPLHTWLCGTPSVESLTELSLGVINQEFEAAQGLMRAAGAVLTRLYLNLLSQVHYRVFLQKQSLSFCPNLQLLSLSFFYFDNHVGTHVNNLLATIPSDCRLKHLEIRFNPRRETDTPFLESLKGIGDILAQEHFRDLELVDVHVHYLVDHPDLTETQRVVWNLLSGLFPDSTQLNVRTTFDTSSVFRAKEDKNG